MIDYDENIPAPSAPTHSEVEIIQPYPAFHPDLIIKTYPAFNPEIYNVEIKGEENEQNEPKEYDEVELNPINVPKDNTDIRYAPLIYVLCCLVIFFPTFGWFIGLLFLCCIFNKKGTIPEEKAKKCLRFCILLNIVWTILFFTIL